MNTSSKFLIYALHDQNGQVRYIGMSTSGLIRPKKHLMKSSYEHPQKAHYHLYNWIRKSLSEGFAPTISVLEYTTKQDLYEKEIFWIKTYRDAGANLTNKVEGGPGMLGLRHTEEVKRNMSINSKGRPISDNLRAYIKTRHGENHPMFGKKHSPETLIKLRESHLGYVMPQAQKDKIGAAGKGRKSPKPPEMIEAMRNTPTKAFKKVRHEDGTVYKSINEAARVLGTTKNTIRNILSGKTKNPKIGRFELVKE